MMDTNKASLFIVAAPSGGGKTSLVRELIATLDNIEVSVSHTTRKARPAEIDGRDYYFLEDAAFLEMIKQDAFVEHAQVFNHYYGTSRAEINARLEAGIDVVLDIDWQGALQIKKLYPDAVGIFILPPSLSVLKQRLHLRRQDEDAVIEKRMLEAKNELRHYADFDYLIVNDLFSKALEELKAIVVVNRLSIQRQVGKLKHLLALLCQ